MDKQTYITQLAGTWDRDARWHGIERPYTAEDVWCLAGTVRIDHSLARRGANRFGSLLESEPHIAVLSAVTGNQAVQQVRAGLRAIYVSGWQVVPGASRRALYAPILG